MAAIQKHTALLPLLFLFALMPVFSISCDRDNNHPGYNYYPDMTDSRAFESYTENPNFSNNMTMRKPVEGTVPRGHAPLPYNKDPESRLQAGIDLKNPADTTTQSLDRGLVLYNRFCLQCHGDLGDGKGYLFTAKLYPFPPASLVNDKIYKVPDGEIFHAITYGYGVMSEHGSVIPPDDRWKIVNYIRKTLQQEKALH